MGCGAPRLLRFPAPLTHRTLALAPPSLSAPACPHWQGSKSSSADAPVNMVDLFTRVLGVFVHYSDEAVDATVKSWNVRLLALNRQSRHRDATVAQEFWRLLDAHLQARGSTLLY